MLVKVFSVSFRWCLCMPRWHPIQSRQNHKVVRGNNKQGCAEVWCVLPVTSRCRSGGGREGGPKRLGSVSGRGIIHPEKTSLGRQTSHLRRRLKLETSHSIKNQPFFILKWPLTKNKRHKQYFTVQIRLDSIRLSMHHKAVARSTLSLPGDHGRMPRPSINNAQAFTIWQPPELELDPKSSIQNRPFQSFEKIKSSK